VARMIALGIWFWLILVLGVIFGGLGYWQPNTWGRFGWLPALLLIAILGWKVFGGPIGH
jgi:hypothetical protein